MPYPKKNIFKKKCCTYQELQQQKTSENHEPFVSLNQNSSLLTDCQKKDMLPFTGEQIFVRQEVAKRLQQAQQYLDIQAPGTKLFVVYGYRHPEIQKKYFEDFLKKHPDITDWETVHQFVAVPEVAGHPTGGAIDITLGDAKGVPLDMGTPIADYTDKQKIQTFAKHISEEQKQNRQLLHDCLVQFGFAPFYGEWWHFSYGDREWAAFYEQKQTLYSQREFSVSI